MSFVKLDSGILDSSLWIDREAREIFITALLLAEPREFTEEMEQISVRDLSKTGFKLPPGWYGFVPAAGSGIVRRAMMDMETGMDALERLCDKDQESRTPDFEGRRMIRVDGGYVVINYMKHRDKDHTAAERMRKLRERKKAQREARESAEQSDTVTRNVTPVHPNVTHSREQKADAYSLKPFIEPSSKESAPAKQTIDERAEEVYKSYPRKVGKIVAKKAIEKAVERLKKSETDDPWEYLQLRTKAFAEKCAKENREEQFIPHPSTWFNEGRYDDDGLIAKKAVYREVSPEEFWADTPFAQYAEKGPVQ